METSEGRLSRRSTPGNLSPPSAPGGRKNPSLAKRFFLSPPLWFLLVFMALAGIFYFLPPFGFYPNDEGLKYVQMKNFHLHGTLAIRYPGQDLGLGPEFLSENLFEIKIRRIAGKLYCIFPPLFTYLSSLFYPLLGERVTHFLPFLAYFFSSVLLRRTLLLLMPEKFLCRRLLLLAFLLSPALLYAFSFTEHLPAIFLVAASLHFLVRFFSLQASRWNLFLSAFSLSLAIFFRTEALFLLSAYLLSLAFPICRRRAFGQIGAAVAGAALPLAAYGGFNQMHYGQPWGLHILYNCLVFPFSPQRVLFFLGTVFVWAALLYIARREPSAPTLKRENCSLLALLWLGFILVFFGPSPASRLFLGFPALLLIFFGSGLNRSEGDHPELGGILLWTIILFLMAVSHFLADPLAPYVRFTLPAIPIAIVCLACESGKIFRTGRMTWFLIAFLLFAAAYGAYTFRKTILDPKELTTRRIEFLRQHTGPGGVILFQESDLLEQSGPLFFDRIFIGYSPRQWARLREVLKAKGRGPFFFYGPDPNLFSRDGLKEVRVISKYQLDRIFLFQVAWE